MKIMVDENIPMVTVNYLLSLDHDVRDIRGTNQQGMDDDLLWRLAQTEQRLFITTDKGFLRFRDEKHHGALIIRLQQPNRIKLHERVVRTIKSFPAKKWIGCIIVVRDQAKSVFKSGAKKS